MGKVAKELNDGKRNQLYILCAPLSLETYRSWMRGQLKNVNAWRQRWGRRRCAIGTTSPSCWSITRHVLLLILILVVSFVASYVFLVYKNILLLTQTFCAAGGLPEFPGAWQPYQQCGHQSGAPWRPAGECQHPSLPGGGGPAPHEPLPGVPSAWPPGFWGLHRQI